MNDCHDHRALLLVLAAFLAGLVLFFAVILIVTGTHPRRSRQSAASAARSSLTDQNGTPSPTRTCKGKPFLVFFGFTHCPDVCPTALFEVSEILRALGPDADRARARCSSPSIPSATRRRSSRTICRASIRVCVGVTGDAGSDRGGRKAYRVYYQEGSARRRRLHHGSHRDRLSDGQDGRFVAPFNMKRDPEAAADDLRRYL